LCVWHAFKILSMNRIIELTTFAKKPSIKNSHVCICSIPVDELHTSVCTRMCVRICARTCTRGTKSQNTQMQPLRNHLYYLNSSCCMTGQKQARSTRCLSQPETFPVHIREKTGTPGAYEIERKQRTWLWTSPHDGQSRNTIAQDWKQKTLWKIVKCEIRWSGMMWSAVYI